ncbi:MAG: hypothetical protein EA409_00350 [Saprospirales bacterium]|nr:MAG: hypothetical protein EA409_00350 [Saprospirales bacterium]
MFSKQLKTKVIILIILFIWISSSGCGWRGGFYIDNSSSSKILLVNYRTGVSEVKDYCLLEKSDTLHYRSQEDCIKIAEFNEIGEEGVYGTVIPPNHILYMGRGPFHYHVNWQAKDPESGEVIDDLNDLSKWKAYPKSLISFRRVFIYEVDGMDGVQDDPERDP